MKLIPRIIIVDDEDDWLGLYRDGILLAEGHLRLTDVLKLLGIAFERKVVDIDWLMKKSGYPKNLKDVKLESSSNG